VIDTLRKTTNDYPICSRFIKVYRGRKVVNRVSLSVKSGQVIGLLGPNGAGKTTTFYMTVGLVRPDGGKVFLDDWR
jgi:lipopolysaccharide export system ATP-binding protein